MKNSSQFECNKLIYYLILLSIRLISIQGELTNIIVTDKGPVQGEIRKTVTNSIPYSSFTGIPYGKPPIGSLRFKVKKYIYPFFNWSIEHIFTIKIKLKKKKQISSHLKKQKHGVTHF